jgi:type I restriction enzyme, S subunit
MENVEAHTMKLLGTVPAATMKSSAVHFQAGDVLYGRLRPYLNKVYRPEFEGLCSAEFIVFPQTEGVNSRYLQYFLNSSAFASFASHLNTGDRPRVDFDQLAPYPLPIPPPYDQERIVAEIEKQFSRLDKTVANLKRVKANLKRYKAAVLKAAVEGKLAPPSGPWKQVALGDITPSIRNGYSKKPDAEQGTRIFRISAVRSMKLDANHVRYLSRTPADYEPFLVEPGDVLFTRYNGSRDYVGVCARVPANLPPTVYPDKLIRVRVPSSMLLPEFLVILASTGHAREYVESKIRTTAGQSGISGSDLKSLPLSIPHVGEQRQIVAEVERRLSVIEELQACVEANLTRADRLRQSVLGTAFTGRLVHQA